MHIAKKLLLVLCVNGCIYGTLAAQQVQKRIPCRLSPDGIIGFLEFKPADYGSQLHPLIIFLHGWDQTGNGRSDLAAVAGDGIPALCAGGASMKFQRNGKSSSFVVLSPQLSRHYGAWPSFYVSEMIKYAKANLQIDSNRIYLTGLSLGGGGVWGAITASAELINSLAAAAPVCATQDIDDRNFCELTTPAHLPVWAFHAMDDKTVVVNTTQHAEILGNICKIIPALKITYYKSGGHSQAWINAYDTGHITTILKDGTSFKAIPNLYEWFLLKNRTDKTRHVLPSTKTIQP